MESPAPQSTAKRNERAVEFRLELVVVPVTDVDRAKAFYVDQAGFNADHDVTVGDEVRFVQLTPPGSACLIAIGKGLSDAEPGSVHGMQVVVTDIEAARAERDRGPGVPLGQFVCINDPDGNRWSVQHVPARP